MLLCTNLVYSSVLIQRVLFPSFSVWLSVLFPRSFGNLTISLWKDTRNATTEHRFKKVFPFCACTILPDKINCPDFQKKWLPSVIVVWHVLPGLANVKYAASNCCARCRYIHSWQSLDSFWAFQWYSQSHLATPNTLPPFGREGDIPQSSQAINP